MKLYLVRHAIAGERDAIEWPDDTQRPLTERGVKRFKRAARGLRRVAPDVDVVLASPSTRAWQTAMILKEVTGWPGPIACEELVNGEPGTVIRALQPYAGADDLALVGHEPHLSRFASSLLGGALAPVLELRKGGIACIELSQLSNVSLGHLNWLLTPRVLRALE